MRSEPEIATMKLPFPSGQFEAGAPKGTGGGEYLPTRQTLLERLKDRENQASWQEFFDLYWRFIHGVARKSGLNDLEARDVVQDTVIAVVDSIGGFHYDPAKGSFKSWLKAVTQHKIADVWRRRHREAWRSAPMPESGCEDTGLGGRPEERVPAPCEHEAIWEKEWRQHLLQLGLDRLKDQINPKHYQILDLSVLRSWPTLKVAKALRVSVAQVYLVRSRLVSQLEKEVRRLEEAGR